MQTSNIPSTVNNDLYKAACNHAVNALTNLLEDFVYRPTTEERKEFSWHTYDSFQIRIVLE